MQHRLAPNPGSIVQIRDAKWKVSSHKRMGTGNILNCKGVSGLTKGKLASFVLELERDFKVLDPAHVDLVEDLSGGFAHTKLFLEAAFRSAAPSTRQPLTIGKAAIDDLEFQHLPVLRALGQDRVRLLIADDVGLGKTLEAGLITSELILRGRADRILVVTTRSMLHQFQKEFWTRFSIPLSRLDSSAIHRMRNSIPAHYNVFDQFERAIVSIDTLKKDSQIRQALADSRWDLVIVDEAHNAARRAKTQGSASLRSELAKLLSRRTDSLLLLTATPHDGSQESFASLIEMLDPTRVPSAADLRREDIDDLVIRRFRSSPEVVDAIKKKVPPRRLHRRAFKVGGGEDQAYDLIANLKLDSDSDGRKKGIDLFRTTLAKAAFSSPAACIETLEGRLGRIASGQAKGTDGDVAQLVKLADALRAITTDEFAKYQDLLAVLREIGWSGRDKRDRLVIFSERIKTVEWLFTRLSEDIALAPGAIQRIDGGSVEADEKTQKLLDDFGQENAPVRILLASDMASEGLNLHFQAHRLFHFDLPWSLLRFQQRNGRIDRYGQDREPQIYYFVGESSHERVRNMWVVEKLVEKDEAAQTGLGDPAVFLGGGDIELEEEVVAEAVARGIGAERFEEEMDERASSATTSDPADDWDVLFGEFTGTSQVGGKEGATYSSIPPRLYSDTFSYTCAVLRALVDQGQGVLASDPRISLTERMIVLEIPDDMKGDGSFGYSRENDVDDRYMPVEAVGRDGKIELTDNAQSIDAAIVQARAQEKSWPSTQYLWDAHPIVSWLGEQVQGLFAGSGAPVCRLKGKLLPGETAVVLHGAIPNQVGASVVDEWGVVRIRNGIASSVQPVSTFLTEIGFTGDLPNGGNANIAQAGQALPAAIDVFQGHLVGSRKARAKEIEQYLVSVLDRLSTFETRFRRQLEMDFADVSDTVTTIGERRRKQKRDERATEVDEMFDDWERWFRETTEMVVDPYPHVDVKAVFVG